MTEKDISGVIKDIVQKVNFLKKTDDASKQKKKERHRIYNMEIEQFLKRSCDKNKFNAGKAWNVENTEKIKKKNRYVKSKGFGNGYESVFIIMEPARTMPSKDELLNWVNSIEKDTQNFLKKRG